MHYPTWMPQGTGQIAAAVAYMVIEFMLPKIDNVKANSVLELVANMLKGSFTAVVGKLSAKKPPTVGPSLLVAWLAGCLAFGGCAYCKQAANHGTALCIAEREISQCGAGAVDIGFSAYKYIAAQDWAGLIQMVYSACLGNDSEAECILNNLKGGLPAQQAKDLTASHSLFKASRVHAK